MKKRPKKILQVTASALTAVVILGIVYLTRPESPQDPTPIKTAPSVQPLSQPEEPKKAVTPVAKPKVSVKKTAMAQPAADMQDWQSQAESALNDPDVSVRMRAVRSLWDNLSPESVELLAMFLDDEETVVTEEAIDALGHIATKSELGEEVLDILLAKVVDNEFRSRGPALLTAAMIGNSETVLPVIDTILLEQNESAREVAVRAISFVNGPQAVPYLTRILAEGGSKELQRNAYSLLIKANTEESRQTIKEAVHSPMRETQVNTVWALARHDTETNVQILSEAVTAKMLADESLSIIAGSRAAPAVFKEAFESHSLTNTDKRNLLRVIANNTKMAPAEVRNQTAETVKPLLNSSDEKMQKDAMDTLVKIGATENQSEALAEHLDSDSPVLQGAALTAYAQYTTPRTYKPLKQLWYDDDEKLRRTAFHLASPFLNLSDKEDLEKATDHKDEFISNLAKLKMKQLDLQEKILSQ
jgi:HEAT repeat protein